MSKKAPADSEQDGGPDPATMRFEAALEELETIIERIEQGEIGLEESLVARRRGESLLKRCRSVLDEAEAELEKATPEELDADAPGS